MSCIASFYLVDIADCETLAASAEIIPKPKRFLGIIPRKVIDTKDVLWETIKTKAKELEEYQYSGFAFVHLLTLYPNIGSTSQSNLGSRLTAAMDSTYISFTEEEARQALDILGPNCPTSEAIRDCLEGDDEAKEWEIPIQASWDILKKWLSNVQGDMIGLLAVG